MPKLRMYVRTHYDVNKYVVYGLKDGKSFDDLAEEAAFYQEDDPSRIFKLTGLELKQWYEKQK